MNMNFNFHPNPGNVQAQAEMGEAIASAGKKLFRWAKVGAVVVVLLILLTNVLVVTKSNEYIRQTQNPSSSSCRSIRPTEVYWSRVISNRWFY